MDDSASDCELAETDLLCPVSVRNADSMPHPRTTDQTSGAMVIGILLKQLHKDSV